MKQIARILFVLVALAALSACAQAAPATQPSNPTAAVPAAGSVTLRMALLPVLDKLPMVVAQEEGLFEKHGVKVEFIPVQSAPERDQLISAGQADGMINEALSTMFYNKDKPQVQIVRYAAAAAPDAPLFSIVAAKNSGIQDAQGLKGVEVGISQGTVIEYLTDRLLKAEGLQSAEIKTIAVPKIGDRLALLGSGELKAGMLPEPLTSLAVQQGGNVVVDDSKHPEFSFSTIAFRKEVIDQNPEAIRAFLAAVEEAVSLINQEPDKYKPLLLEQQILPPPLAESFHVRKFVTAGVPTQAQWDDTLAWAKKRGLLAQDVAYADSVVAGFLPK